MRVPLSPDPDAAMEEAQDELEREQEDFDYRFGLERGEIQHQQDMAQRLK